MQLIQPANPDLADILGDADFDFENVHVIYVWDSNFVDFPGPQISNIWSRTGRAGIEPSRPKDDDFLL